VPGEAAVDAESTGAVGQPAPGVDSSRLRPLVDVIVGCGGRDASYVLLVDSGADVDVFSAEVARELGIALADGEMLGVRGATGDEAVLWRHPVTITVGGCDVPVLAASGEAEHLEAVGLAGQEGFFDQFRVTFDRRAGVFELDPCNTGRRGGLAAPTSSASWCRSSPAKSRNARDSLADSGEFAAASESVSFACVTSASTFIIRM
jgi:hypothetical protein